MFEQLNCFFVYSIFAMTTFQPIHFSPSCNIKKGKKSIGCSENGDNKKMMNISILTLLVVFINVRSRQSYTSTSNFLWKYYQKLIPTLVCSFLIYFLQAFWCYLQFICLKIVSSYALLIVIIGMALVFFIEKKIKYYHRWFFILSGGIYKCGVDSCMGISFYNL